LRVIECLVLHYIEAGCCFSTPSAIKHVVILKFNLKNELYLKLAKISKRSHQFKSEDKEKDIEKLEKENDEIAKRLFGITK